MAHKEIYQEYGMMRENHMETRLENQIETVVIWGLQGCFM